jgi:hypothetical protein
MIDFYWVGPGYYSLCTKFGDQRMVIAVTENGTLEGAKETAREFGLGHPELYTIKPESPNFRVFDNEAEFNRVMQEADKVFDERISSNA